MIFDIDQSERDYFIKRIREWGGKNFIKYPWRYETNIYRILLTEVFLQKTDALKVKNIYPLIKQIEEPTDLLNNKEVLDHIISKIGLSYRKERIIRLSRQILDEYSGKIPDNYRDLRRLVGIGDYIANAVLSFGKKKRTPIVETNTIRIIESFFGYQTNKNRAREDRQINQILLTILPQKKYVMFNYFLLDFGALVCTKAKKNCPKCVLKRRCNWFIIRSNEIRRD